MCRLQYGRQFVTGAACVAPEERVTKVDLFQEAAVPEPGAAPSLQESSPVGFGSPTAAGNSAQTATLALAKFHGS
jgi:hypothetical protein